MSAISDYQREALKKAPEIEAQLSELNKSMAKESKAAKPKEEYAATASLNILKCLDSNNLSGAREQLEAMVALYYRSHKIDGDTNLLTNIAEFAATDTNLFMMIHGRIP